MPEFVLSSNSKKNRKGVDQKLIEIDDLAIKLTLVDYGHDRYSGLRDAELQHELFMAGKSQCDGYIKFSNHQRGKALDFFAFVDGKPSWEPEHLAIVACAYFQAAAILGYRIRWGGLWKSKDPKVSNGVPYGWDMPHIELIED